MALCCSSFSSPSSRLSGILLLTLAAASPIDPVANALNRLRARQDNSSSILAYSLPGSNDLLRQAGIATKQATFTYAPAVGAGPYYPGGVLGLAYDAADSAEETVELGAEALISSADYAKANLDSPKYGNLTTLDDYVKLYDDEWVASSMPTGQMPGILTNYTQDLLFSMERLSFSPYAVRRLFPDTTDTLPFQVDDSIVTNLTGQTLDSLFTSGHLFYADHRNQSTLPHNDGKYTANCDAYFYIHPTSGDFLPLAIRTNFGNDLVYTPADGEGDWLLAKIMYNVNDFFMDQWDHFARNHFVVEIVYAAAVRTLSDSHPVLAVMKRLAFEAYAIRPLAMLILFSPGGVFDKYFGYGGAASRTFVNETYFNGFAGAFHSNYFISNLESRGLVNSPLGPALKSFPFYEDASPIYDAIRAFTGSFIDSYYADDAAVANDAEVQAWVTEATGPAGVIDFPTTLATKADLADLIAEVARLTSFSHHTQNLNSLITGSSTLPFHPTALWKQVPSAKGVAFEDVATWLPPLDACLGTIQFGGFFSRPLLAGTNRSAINMWNDEVMLAGMNDATRAANGAFMSALTARSAVVKGRTFDAEGLSQGMPFLWKGLDPDVIPWSLTV